MIPLKNVKIERYYNKLKYLFDVEENRGIIEKVKLIEENILQRIAPSMESKTPQYNISDNFINQNIKMHMNNFIDENSFNESQIQLTNNFILKISGVWSTDENYGLTYKHFQPSTIF